MNQTERRIFLIKRLIDEQPRYKDLVIPQNTAEQKSMLRSLFNIRMPASISDDFLSVQDEYLKEETAAKGITDIAELSPVSKGIYLWQGDITTLRCDAVVNAANSGMTGCYAPCHSCIDNCIHTYAGVQLRLECAKLMKVQEREEETGKAKITPAYNLSCKYVIHTVGPMISGRLTENDKKLLESCYRSCLDIAEQNSVKSIAFCCISTGEFRFPNDKAAEIAIRTVMKYIDRTDSDMEVIFNVFKDIDYEIYRNLLG
ncbi:MAG: protein-ADP-ribose hydrolase, partial [Oscillospiraceae bacterium]|nr:protein-ADP-ribose hydrolase [Oscillospiraceae bacterium]